MGTIRMKLPVSFLVTMSTVLISNISYAGDSLWIDLFSRPNDSTLDYYGSGDVFMDNRIDSNDVSRLDSLLDGTLSVITDNRILDRADINGDGIFTATDRKMLEDYYENDLYFPSDWNYLSRMKKIRWFEKMVLIDRTDTLTHTARSHEYAIPFAINFHGFCHNTGAVFLAEKYTFTDNGFYSLCISRGQCIFNQLCPGRG